MSFQKNTPVHAKIIMLRNIPFMRSVTFELDDGERITFPLVAVQCNQLLEGDTGMLICTRNTFKSFVRDQK